MLLVAALLWTSVVTSAALEGGRLDCRCGDALCSCLVLRPAAGALLCVQGERASHCSPVAPAASAAADSRLMRLLTGQVAVANPDCRCGGKFCACTVVMSSMEDQICLHASDGPVCSSAEKATKRYGLLSRIISEGAESHDACQCSGAACACSWRQLRPDSVVCLHAPQRLDCAQAQHGGAAAVAASLASDDDGPACSCYGTRCSCRWEVAMGAVEVCVYSDEGARCHPMAAPAPSAPQLQVLQRVRRSEPELGCRCSNNICTCGWPGPKLEAGLSVCLEPRGVCDTVETLDPLPKQTVALNSCSCSSTQCTCKWSKVKKGDNACYHSAVGVNCIGIGTVV